MPDKLIKVADVGPILGGLHVNDVRRLIHDGKLVASPQVVRGKGKNPRLYVTESEVARYIKSLSAGGGAAEQVEPKRRRRGGIAKELAAATAYY